jgi:hypothetical protein
MEARIDDPAGRSPGAGPAWDRLEDQIGWYDRKSIAAQHAYKRLKVLQLVAAAGVPVAAAIEATAWVTAALGGLVLVLEGIQQLGQYQANWIAYRATCESLKHEKHLYLAGAGPYTDPAKAPRSLAERVEGLVSQEHAKWVASREESDGAGR